MPLLAVAALALLSFAAQGHRPSPVLGAVEGLQVGQEGGKSLGMPTADTPQMNLSKIAPLGKNDTAHLQLHPNTVTNSTATAAQVSSHQGTAEAAPAAAAHALHKTLDTGVAWYEAEGSRCTAYEKKQMLERFQIGAKFGKPCKDEDEWGDKLEYKNPKSPDLISLYIYPMEDHNNAFGLCTEGDGNRFSMGFCHRLFGQTEHYSVYFHRVHNVEEAIEVVRKLPANIKIKHLVLGGHGASESLGWGAEGGTGTIELEVEDDVADELFDAVYPHLLKNDGETFSTVFLDACLNGKKTDDKNMIQHVAHRLAGAKVYASKISWDNDEFELDSSKNFAGKIISEKTGKNRMRVEQYGTGELRKWTFWANEFCDDKASRHEQGVRELPQCRERCEADASCKSFVWYPEGNKDFFKKCYLSKKCEYSSPSKMGAMIFDKPK